MRKILQYLLKVPLTWLANYLSAAPKKEVVFKSLTQLYDAGIQPDAAECIILEADAADAKFIIFSDQHKGNKTWADDFAASEKNYIEALKHYNGAGFNFINLGDSEELWKFKAEDILPKNIAAFAAEAAFHPTRYFKTFGNHDLLWKNSLDVALLLKHYFTMPLPVFEGVILRLKHAGGVLEIFLTHGHQGDVMSDNNGLSTWIVAHIWMPVQRYLRLNINTPSQNFSLRNKHNQMMHEWSSSKQNLLLITGHTHSPVFASGRYLAHPSNDVRSQAPQHRIQPSYFNSGCCCFSDGDITGIEIDNGSISLIKWTSHGDVQGRKVLETVTLSQLVQDMAGDL